MKIKKQKKLIIELTNKDIKQMKRINYNYSGMCDEITITNVEGRNTISPKWDELIREITGIEESYERFI